MIFDSMLKFCPTNAIVFTISVLVWVVFDGERMFVFGCK